jgi:hypothetical protein
VNTQALHLPGWLPPESGPPTTPPRLLHCLLLAALLHLWLVLLLGNADGGTAQQGKGVWGAINITLRGPKTLGGTADVKPPELLPPSGPAGTATSPRFGGTVREPGPALAPEPGAAQLGNWTATPLPKSDKAELPAAASPTPRQDAPQSSIGPPPTQGRVTEERATELPATPPGPIPVQAPPPAPMPSAEPAPTPSPERSLSSTLSRLGGQPAPVQPLNNNPVDNPSLRPLALPARLPDLAPPLPAAPVVPPVSTPPPPTPAPALVAPVSPAAPPAAVASPAPAAAPPGPEPAPVDALPVLRTLGGTGPMQPQTTSPSAALQTDTAPASAPTLPTLQRTPALGPAVAAAAPAAPDAGPRAGQDVATPASNAASAAPRLNLQLARPRSGELPRGGSTGVLSLLPRPPETASQLSKDIDKAAKPDCAKAYSGAGLLAVPLLLVDSLRKDGCKW